MENKADRPGNRGPGKASGRSPRLGTIILIFIVVLLLVKSLFFVIESAYAAVLLP
jgi:regulator of protease activity HflC (stomatin/prohibitin superfamily)